MGLDNKRQSIRHNIRRAERRIRMTRALWRMPTALTVALTAAGVALALRKVAPDSISESGAWAVMAGAGLSVLVAGLVAWWRALPPYAGALVLDRYHALRGRLSNAVAFEEGAQPPASLDVPWRRAAIDDAYRAIGELEPRAAVPIRWPAELGVSLAVGLAVFALASFEVSIVESLRAESGLATFESDPLQLSEDDLDALRASLDVLAESDASPEVKQAVERFNQLVEDLAQRRLERSEAFRRMSQIEDELLRGARADRQATDDGLRDTAKELAKSELARPVSEALKNGDLAEAEKRMRKLADRLRMGGTKSDKKQVERLRKALERAASHRKEALSQIDEKRAEQRRQLLKRKRELEAKPRPDHEERRLLKKKRRQLERLDRKREQHQRAMRRLSRLDRQLAKAAQDLMRDLGLSANDLDRAAQDINRLKQQRMSDEEKERLRRRLEQLRQMIRQQGKGGARRLQRLKRFGKRARGGKKRSGRPGRGGRQGKGDGEAQRPGGIVFGPGGQPIPVPGGAGPDGASPGGAGEKGEGQSWGSGPGGDPKGKHTDIKGQSVDVRAEAVDTEQGHSNAEVIHSAGQRGFSSQPYRKVYTKYRTVAEGQIEKEKIPDGMRFYVRRYFQLIRPRN